MAGGATIEGIVWFGESWGALVCTFAEHRPTITGMPCVGCSQAIVEGDSGVVIPSALLFFHAKCIAVFFMRTSIHGLRSGRVVCGFHDGPPVEWPQSPEHLHFWSPDPKDWTCKVCIEQGV